MEKRSIRFEVFHQGLLARHDVIAVDMVHHAGLWGPCFSHHQPHNGHPRYSGDTTTEGVLRFLSEARRDGTDSLDRWRDFTITTHHVDSDAVLPVWALMNPEMALERANRLTEVARSGDFFIHYDNAATKINVLIESLHHRMRASGERGERVVNDQVTRDCFDWLLPRLESILDCPDAYSEFWDAPMQSVQADIAYLRAPGRVTESFNSHTSVVLTDHRLNDCALNTVCRNDLLLVWRTDKSSREISVRPAIGWYDLNSIPHQPRYDLEFLAARLNRAEPKRSVIAAPWAHRPGPRQIGTTESSLSIDDVSRILAEWIDAATEESIPGSYRADVRQVFPQHPVHATFNSHRRFAGAASIQLAPGRPYSGIHCAEPGPSLSREGVACVPGGKDRVPFLVSDDFCWNARDTGAMQLVVTLQDPGEGEMWIEYDAWADPYTATTRRTLESADPLATLSFTLDNPRFGNSQDLGADFSVRRAPGMPLAIRDLVLARRAIEK